MTVSKPILFGGLAAIVVVVLVGIGYFAYAREHQRVAEIEEQLKKSQKDLASYAQYAKHLAVAKQTLTEQKSALAVPVIREQAVYVRVRKSPAVFRADADVILHLAIHYSYGFDLAPEKFELEATPGEIVATVGPPTLMAMPVVKLALVEMADKSIVLDQDKAVAELMKQVTEDFAAKGMAMAKDEDVKALCEKKLIASLRDAIEKQPDVKFVPGIIVSYRP